MFPPLFRLSRPFLCLAPFETFFQAPKPQRKLPGKFVIVAITTKSIFHEMPQQTKGNKQKKKEIYKSDK